MYLHFLLSRATYRELKYAGAIWDVVLILKTSETLQSLISIMHLFSTWNSSKTSSRFKKPGQQSTEDSSVLIPWAFPISHDLNAVSRILSVPDSCAQACVTGPGPGDRGLGWKTDGRLWMLWTREGTRENRTRPAWPFTLDSGQRFDGHLGEVNDTTTYEHTQPERNEW